MEIIQNRYGVDRVIEKIGDTKIRVMGESEFSRGSMDSEGNTTMFDFEGGPCFNIGGSITYKGTKFEIKSIEPENTNKENITSVVLEVRI